MSYTLPNGRQASRRERERREKLLQERDNCPDCKERTRIAVENGYWHAGACQCPMHRS